jgi:hypothetical protein
MYVVEEKYIWDLVWKPEGKRPLGIVMREWEDNSKMDL